MVPKLVAEDIPLLFSLLSDVFPGVQYMRGEMTALREELKKVCAEMYLTYGDGDDVGSMWVEKVCCEWHVSTKQFNSALFVTLYTFFFFAFPFKVQDSRLLHNK